MTKLKDEINRGWEDVARRIDDPARIELHLRYVVGFLLGADNALGAALMIALAEKAYGPRVVLDLKRQVGLAGSLSAPADPKHTA